MGPIISDRLTDLDLNPRRSTKRPNGRPILFGNVFNMFRNTPRLSCQMRSKLPFRKAQNAMSF
jgi:hypothetical protein